MAKTGFSYTSQFTWESNFNGVKRTWLFTKNGTEFEISLVNETETEEDNGTTIIIPIKNDYYEWRDAIKECLLYFKGVIVESNFLTDFNTQRLFEGNHFYYRENSNFNDFHIVLDQVIYEINPTDLGLYNKPFPFGIKFGLDEGLIPTPAKDKILLNDYSKELIRNRVKSVLEELNQLSQQKFNGNLYNYLSKPNYNYVFNLKDIEVHISKDDYKRFCSSLNVSYPIEEYTPIDPEFKNVQFDKRRLLTLLLKPYSFVGSIRNGSFRNSGGVNLQNKILIMDEKISNLKIEFLKTLFSYVDILKFDRSDVKLTNYKSQYSGLGLEKKDFNTQLIIPKSKWRETIIAWQKEEDNILNSFPKFSDYTKEYEDWLKNRPKRVKVSKLGTKEDDEITVKLPVNFDVRNSDFNMKFEPQFLKVSTLNKKYYIYSSDRKEVDLLYDLWLNSKNIVPILLNKTEINKVAHLPNCVSYQEFSKGKSRFAQKWVTAWLIHKEIRDSIILSNFFSKNYSGFNSTINSKNIKSLRSSQKDINEVCSYLNKWLKSNNDNTFVESVSETYLKLGLIDKPMLDQFHTLKKKLLNYYFLTKIKDFNNESKFIDHVILIEKKNKMNERKINKLQQELLICKSNII